jgi:signal transduction histidine kinase
MIVVVFFGTASVLRNSSSSIKKQYSERVQRTLQRVTADFNSLDGRIAFDNLNWPDPNKTGVPIFKLPLDYINVIPGHVEELRSLDACSYASKTNSKSYVCAGVIKKRAYGSLLYIQGSFESFQDLVPSIYSDALSSGHHFIVEINARGTISKFQLTLDSLKRTENFSSSLFSPAWSLTGFKITSNPKNSYYRETEVKGRVLKVSNDSNRFMFIFQIPIYSYREDVFTETKQWPPLDISSARVNLILAGPQINQQENILLDTKDSERAPLFSFEKMNTYLTLGESLEFHHRNEKNSVTVKPFPEDHISPTPSYFRLSINRFSDKIIRMVLANALVSKSAYLSDGNSISLLGNALAVSEGWRDAAQSIIAFAIVLVIFLIMIIAIFCFFVILPLNRVRRNTLYMQEKFTDVEYFNLPYTIETTHDEIGVLWMNIFDLHKSITLYGRRAQEIIQAEGATLRAIGHEIKSPLQDLMLRHNSENDLSTKSIRRISHAIDALTRLYSGREFGSRGLGLGPQDAINALSGNLTKEDVSEYLKNAADSEIKRVEYINRDGSLFVHVDADMLEGALTAIINNANDFRVGDTDILISTYSDQDVVWIRISNKGPKIDFEPIEQIFEFGVSNRLNDPESNHQGLGLFLAKSYIGKMGGELGVKNTTDGVLFEITLIRVH